jgi:hypothetical protein
MSQPAQPSGQTGTTSSQTDRSMQGGQSQGDKSHMHKSDSQMHSKSGQAGRGGSGDEAGRTAALNQLSAEGYTPTSRIERVGNAWQATAMKEGKQVTVQIDPQTNRVTER